MQPDLDELCREIAVMLSQGQCGGTPDSYAALDAVRTKLAPLLAAAAERDELREEVAMSDGLARSSIQQLQTMNTKLRERVKVLEEALTKRVGLWMPLPDVLDQLASGRFDKTFAAEWAKDNAPRIRAALERSQP